MAEMIVPGAARRRRVAIYRSFLGVVSHSPDHSAKAAPRNSQQLRAVAGVEG